MGLFGLLTRESPRTVTVDVESQTVTGVQYNHSLNFDGCLMWIIILALVGLALSSGKPQNQYRKVTISHAKPIQHSWLCVESYPGRCGK